MTRRETILEQQLLPRRALPIAESPAGTEGQVAQLPNEVDELVAQNAAAERLLNLVGAIHGRRVPR